MVYEVVLGNEESKRFFFEKKKQKTFAPGAVRAVRGRTQRPGEQKFFCFFFFKKRSSLLALLESRRRHDLEGAVDGWC